MSEILVQRWSSTSIASELKAPNMFHKSSLASELPSTSSLPNLSSCTLVERTHISALEKKSDHKLPSTLSSTSSGTITPVPFSRSTNSTTESPISQEDTLKRVVCLMDIHSAQTKMKDKPQDSLSFSTSNCACESSLELLNMRSESLRGNIHSKSNRIPRFLSAGNILRQAIKNSNAIGNHSASCPSVKENKTESIGVKVVKGKTIRRVQFAPMVEVIVLPCVSYTDSADSLSTAPWHSKVSKNKVHLVIQINYDVMLFDFTVYHICRAVLEFCQS